MFAHFLRQRIHLFDAHRETERGHFRNRGGGFALDVQDAFDPEHVFAAHADERAEPHGEGVPLERFFDDQAMGPNAPVVAIHVVRVLVSAAMTMVAFVAVVMMIVAVTRVRLFVQPALDVGDLCLGVPKSGLEQVAGIGGAVDGDDHRRAWIEPAEACL